MVLWDAPPRDVSAMLLTVMAATKKSSPRSIRAQLDREVVAPVFAGLKASADASVPAVVVGHRKRRAQERLLDALVSRGSATVPKELSREIEKLVAQWAKVSFADGFEPIAAFEIRCAREHDRVVAEESGDPERLLEVLDREHRRRVVEQFGRLELRGIQTSHRVFQELDQAYVPLHLEAPLEVAPEEGGPLTIDLSRRRLGVPNVLRDHRHILLVGSPGSGKSTLIAYLASRAAKGLLAEDLGERGTPLPLIIAVRSLTNPSFSEANLARQAGCEEALLVRALESQCAILFIDGLDEAPEGQREKLVSSVHRFQRRYPKIRLIVTSRPAGAPGEIENQLLGLSPFRLVDLTREEVDLFIDRWCLGAELSVRRDEVEAHREARKAADDLKARLARSYAVQKIAVSPLLTSILCVVHRFLGQTIPEHRVTLYDKCTDALFYEWDRAKFAEDAAIGQLDATAKRRLLMGIARRVHEEHAAEIAEKEVVQHFAEILPDLGRPAGDAQRVVEEIRDRSGVLVERRPGFFAFSHLTFQEYLCALDFVRTKQLSELLSHYEDPWWHEVIVLAAGMPGAGSGTIARRLVAKKKPPAVFLAAQCLETEVDTPVQVRRDVEAALRPFVPPKDPKQARRLADLGTVVVPAVASALRSSNASDRGYCLMVFWHLDFDPVIPLIAAHVGDDEPSAYFHLAFSEAHPTLLPVGGLALQILARKAGFSDLALRVLPAAASRARFEELRWVLDELPLFVKNRRDEILAIFQKEIRARDREGSLPPMPARNTA